MTPERTSADHGVLKPKEDREIQTVDEGQAERPVGRGYSVVPRVPVSPPVEVRLQHMPTASRLCTDRSSAHPLDSGRPSAGEEFPTMFLSRPESDGDNNANGNCLQLPFPVMSTGVSDESGGELAHRTPRSPVEPASEGLHSLSSTARPSKLSQAPVSRLR